MLESFNSLFLSLFLRPAFGAMLLYSSLLQTFANPLSVRLSRFPLRWLTDNHLKFLLGANIVIAVIAAILSSGVFLSGDNFQSMGTQLPEVGLLALAIMITMLSGNGGIDLSVVAVANLTAVIAGKISQSLFNAETQGLEFAFLFPTIAMLAGLGCGLVNGMLVAFGNFTPILATLGTQLVFGGIAVVLTNGSALSLGYIDAFVQIGNGQIFGIPIPFILFLIVSSILAWLFTNTRYGFRLYLTGTNAKAAHFAGINNRNILLLTYTIAGLLAALSGIISASRASSAKADYGSSYLLIAILISVMGGVNPAGGSGKVLGLVLASFALQMLSSTLNLIGLSNFLKDFTWGLLLLLTIALTSSTTNSAFNFLKAKKEVNAT
jgi:simple sugar transport system permease protein